jgi:predicted Fe-S protein YdhL (DUF1289 family)
MLTASPCIKVCKLIDSICIGCKRTIQEISTWVNLSEKQKQEINARITLRH